MAAKLFIPAIKDMEVSQVKMLHNIYNMTRNYQSIMSRILEQLMGELNLRRSFEIRILSMSAKNWMNKLFQ